MSEEIAELGQELVAPATLESSTELATPEPDPDADNEVELWSDQSLLPAVLGDIKFSAEALRLKALLSPRQQKKIELYALTGNLKQSCISAGYTPGYQGGRYVSPTERLYLYALLEVIATPLISKAAERMYFLTEILRGEREGDVKWAITTLNQMQGSCIQKMEDVTPVANKVIKFEYSVVHQQVEAESSGVELETA